MEQPERKYSFPMQNHILDVTSPRGGPRFDGKLHLPFQAIIDKGKQAKAQLEQDQYDARKARRDFEIKNAARIRHAEAEANRRRAEESKLSIDEHKGKLLDDMTKNIKAKLEDQFREEIRAKVYEDEDRIVSGYEHDIKDQTKARLVRELESVVKAKLEAEFEPEIKQQLAVELVSVVKAELRAKYETEVKQQLTEELQSAVMAELRAKLKEDNKNQLVADSVPTVVHKQRGTQTNDIEHEPQSRRDTLHTPDGHPFQATPNDIVVKGGEYPDLFDHEHLIGENGIQNGHQRIPSVQNMENFDTNGDPVALPHGTKRSVRSIDDEEKDSYARHSKRSRSASFNSQEQQLRRVDVEGLSNPYNGDSDPLHDLQAMRHNGKGNGGLSHFKGDASREDAQLNTGDNIDRGASGYNSFNDVPHGQENILDNGSVGYQSAGNLQGTNGDLTDLEGTRYDSAEDVQRIDENLSYHEEVQYNRNENFLDHEGVDYDSAEDIQLTSGHKMGDEGTDSDSSDEDEGVEGEEDEEEEYEGEYEEGYEEEYEEEYEEYEGEEDERYSTTPQTTPHSKGESGVISFSNTQDTAFVLSDDSEDDAEKAGDEDKTLVGYDGPAALIDAKHLNMPVEESLFLDA